MLCFGLPAGHGENRGEKELDRKNSRTHILNVARKLFLKQGYNGVSLREIAAAAGLTTGAVYHHFKNKKEIYNAICFEAGDMLVSLFHESEINQDTPSKKLISIYDSFISFFYRHRDYYNILMEYKAEYSGGKGDSEDIIKKMAEVAGVVEPPILQGIDEGIFRTIDPKLLAMFLAAVSEGMLQYKKIGLFDYMGISDSDFRSFMYELVGRGIRSDP